MGGEPRYTIDDLAYLIGALIDRIDYLSARSGAGAAQWLGTSEAARALGVSTATVRSWIRSGRLPATRIGRKWMIARADVDGAPAVRGSRRK